MTTAPPHIGDRRENPISGARTTKVVFGYLNLNFGIVHALTTQGKADEDRVIGPYVPGSGDPIPPLGQVKDEAVIIAGKPHPICAGQYTKQGKRKNGIVVIDATGF